MARQLFSTILKEVQEAPDEDKAIILQTNNSLMLRQLLAAALSPAVKFDVAVPPYRENNEVDGYAANNLYVESRRLYIFLEGYKEITAKRKTDLLAQVLESIDPADAIALTDVINKDLSKYGITKEIVNEAFPGLIK